jgi:transposase InsO family protein
MHPQTKLTPFVQAVVIEAKRKSNYGPEKMKLHLKKECHVSVSTTAIYKFFKKKRLIRKPQKKMPWYRPMKKRLRNVKQPGQNVQLDVKYVPGESAKEWAYQYRFIDVLTNMQFALNCLDRSTESSICAFKKAETFFPFVIQGIQTDNGGEFRGVFAEYLKQRSILHRFIPKRSAPWNGKVERANRSVDDEFYLNPTRPWSTLAEYVRWYNNKRYHLGKGMRGRTPNQRYQDYLTHRQKQSPLKVN